LDNFENIFEEIFYLSQGFIDIDSNLTLGVKKLP